MVKSAVYDMTRDDENTFWTKHRDALHVVLKPNMSTRDNVIVNNCIKLGKTR